MVPWVDDGMTAQMGLFTAPCVDVPEAIILALKRDNEDMDWNLHWGG